MVAPQIAGFAAYRRPVAEALLRVKLRHWDDQLRGLAARALALLVPLEPEFFVEVALPELRAAAISTVLEVGRCQLPESMPSVTSWRRTLCCRAWRSKLSPGQLQLKRRAGTADAVFAPKMYNVIEHQAQGSVHAGAAGRLLKSSAERSSATDFLVVQFCRYGRARCRAWRSCCPRLQSQPRRCPGPRRRHSRT